MRAVLVTVVLALAVAGCGGGEEQSAAAPSGKLAGPLKFLLTGGEAFRRDRITVQPDGSAQVETLEGEKAAQLTDEELGALAAQLEDADLQAIPEDSLTKPPIPDAPGYSFVYQGREVSTDSGSMPDQLKPLAGTMVRLVDRYGAK